jgi:predicted phosphodiesterase
MSTNTQVDDALVLRLAGDGLSNVAISDIVDCDESSVRRSLKRSGFKRHRIPTDLTERFLFDLDTPVVVKNEDLMVTADWHIPVYNPHLVNEMIETAREQEITKLVIGGDFWNKDQLSQYFPKQSSAGYKREWKEGIAVAKVLVETFEEIFFVWGNHDYRLAKSLGYALDFVDSMRLVFGVAGDEVMEKFRFTNLDHIWLLYGEPVLSEAEAAIQGLVNEWERYLPHQRWYVCHPQNYTRVPLNTARTLTTKVNANVVTAHAHHAAVGYGINGKLVAAEAGGMFDPAVTAYLQRSTTFPCWTPGYGFIKDSRFRLVTPHFG